MNEWNFKASDNKGEMIIGLGFSLAFIPIVALILILRLWLFPKIKFSNYISNSLLERMTIIFSVLALVPYVMKIIKKYAIKNYHIYEDKEILKIENDNKIIELSYSAIKDIKFDKKEKGISSCYKLIIKTSKKDLKFIIRPKENFIFGGSDENDFYSLEDFYFFLKEKKSIIFKND